MESQIYANEGTYKLKLELTTNENNKITSEFSIEIHDPVASIKVDKVT